MALIRKKDITEKLLTTSKRRERIGSHAAADDIVTDVFNIIIAEVMRGNDVAIAGLGKIRVKTYKGRKCRNVHTGAEMFVPPTLNVKFDVEPAAKRELNRVHCSGVFSK